MRLAVALTLSGLGGVIGVALGLAVSALIARVGDITFAFSPATVGVSFATPCQYVSTACVGVITSLPCSSRAKRVSK